MCNLCQSKVETAEHTLLLYPWVAEVWRDPAETEAKQTTPPTWRAPRTGCLKLNIDGSLGPEGAVACVVRDSSGTLLDGFTKTVWAESILQVETLGVLEALKFLQGKESVEAVVETDAKLVVENLNSELQAESTARGALKESKLLLQKMSHVELAHCPRSANAVADWAASHHRKKSLPLNWRASPPSALWALLCIDAPEADLRGFRL
ncbi:uncharacterized protein LOC120296136 [Eucalyptus grandis]|uniref:uncharacterized protein LOC120296136 n=1 Tax=Eucalyptus grandis TaxID=71139 RepID=UPI00192E9492|nr:uncharacterized protein LOC120296136 [Eucalyptus grandis]